MKYEVNRFSKSGFFMVPAEVADRFLKLATHDQLKVMLKVCSLGAPEFDTEDIAKELRISDEQAKEAVDFWASAGFFISRNAPVKEPKPEAHPAKKAVRAATVKPDRNEVARRGTEEPQIAFLLGEAQKKLGRALKPPARHHAVVGIFHGICHLCSSLRYFDSMIVCGDRTEYVESRAENNPARLSCMTDL